MTLLSYKNSNTDNQSSDISDISHMDYTKLNYFKYLTI